MRKYFLLPTLAALLLTGCSSITNYFNDTVDEFTTDTDIAYDEGGAITSLNRYTDLVNSARDEVEYVESDVIYFEGDMIDGYYEPYFTCDFYLYDRESLEWDTQNPTGLEDSEKEDLVAQATAIFATLDVIESECKELSKYVTAKDYEADDYAQGKVLVENLYTQIDTYYDQHGVMLDTLDLLYDKYDTWVVDPSDPISVGIDNMDKDLDQADAILDMIEEAADSENFATAPDVQTAYDLLTASVADHTGENAPVLYDSYYYDDFYDTMEITFLPTIKRSIRDMQNSDVDATVDNYYDVLDSYNLMIDYYNYFLDATGY